MLKRLARPALQTVTFHHVCDHSRVVGLAEAGRQRSYPILLPTPTATEVLKHCRSGMLARKTRNATAGVEPSAGEI